MRRDYFTLTVEGIEPPVEKPTLTIGYEGPTGELRERLGYDGEELETDEIDIAYRLRGDPEEGDADGVVAITNRHTGEYILELNAPVATVLEFVEATEEYQSATGDDRQFRVVIEADGEELAEYEQSALLVYDEEGTLLRQHSLIPSGVEL